MKKTTFFLTVLLSLLMFMSCDSDDDNDNTVTAPTTYSFERNGNSTVSFGGQTTRILMNDEIANALKVNTNTEIQLDAMFAHIAGVNDFSDANLNASGKNVRSKIAASTDFFSSNTTDAIAIKAQFDTWISSQVNEVFPNWETTATVGQAGQLQQADSGSIRYLSAKGLEYNQVYAKGSIGGLMADQILNNYLSTAVLDAGNNVANNDNEVLEEGKNYTLMEHKWDEGFGYLYGNEVNPAVPVLNADSFLNKYLDSVDSDSDFTGIAADIFDAFKLGRAAIVAKNYTVRDEQIVIIKENISKVIAIRAVFYLQAGKADLETDNAKAFHNLSKGFGFVYSLQFTRKPNSNEPYFTKAQVDQFLSTLLTGNGFWDLTPTTLDTMSNTISNEFDFTTAQAGS